MEDYFPLKHFKLIIFFIYYFKLSVHFWISESDALELNLCPSFQFPEPAICSSIFPLWPNPDDEDVQNGITVFPSKLLSFTKLFIGHAAIPHHIG